jgi:O-antigen ligase
MSAWPSPRNGVLRWLRELGTARGLGLLLVAFLGAMLLVRVLTDDLSAPDSRHTGSLNLSGVIAVLFMLVALGLLVRRRHGLLPTVLVALWLCLWTAIAVNTSGASSETLREGVREMSVVALFVVVYNARNAVTVPIATRLVQLAGLAPALVALYQLVTFTGTSRPYGTFAHPDSAAMFFAIAATVSLWRYLDDGRKQLDALLIALFAAAVVATSSIDGLITLVAMLTVLGALRPGSLRVKLGPCVIAGVVILAFFATPLGSHRIAKESATKVEANGEPNSSLAWRLHKWKTLIPEWEQTPIFGQGLGTTTTALGAPRNLYAGKPPHNEYIRYLVETGVVGLSVLLAALALLIRSLLRRRRILGSVDAGTLNAPSLALTVIAGCLVNSLADNTLLNSPTCYAAALIVAAVLALPAIEAQQAPAGGRC